MNTKCARWMRIITSICFLIISIPLCADNAWIGRWQAEPIIEDNEICILEYDFKNDSILTMSFITDNQIPNVGRCVSKITIDGTYFNLGQFFFVSLDQNTLNVEILKFYSKDSAITEKSAKQSIRENAEPLFSGYDNVMMIYITHENPDEISFIVGDENNAMELKLHRQRVSIEDILKIQEIESTTN